MKSKNITKKESEPVVESYDFNHVTSSAVLSRLFNWYNYEKTQTDAFSYLKEYTKANIPTHSKDLSRVPEKYVSLTLGWLSRIATNGATLTKEQHTRIEKHVVNLVTKRVIVDEVKELNEVLEPKRPTIQESLMNKRIDFFGDLSAELDDFILNNCRPTKFDLYKFMQGQNLPQQFGIAVGTLFEPTIDELNDIDNNEQLKEAYSCYTDAQIKRIKEWLQVQIDAGLKYANYKKANRKPKARKAKPPIKQVERLKYLREFENLKSIPASTIIGQNQLWVYNVKYKRLGVYYATGSSGFSVKGSTLQGYDPEVSIWKTLRKPNETIPLVMSGGKLQLQAIMKNLTTTVNQLNGRINEETILLRVL